MRLVPGSGSLSLCLLGVLIFLLQASILLALCLKPKIPNGKLSVETNHYVNPETITIQCNPGYRMVGSQNISCSENKSWSPAVPKYQMEAVCGENHYVNPETITIQCNPGYRMVGSQNISCSENKSWSPAVPKCEIEVPEDRDIVLAGKNLLQCLPSPRDSKVALELHKLSLQIEKLKQDRDKRKII
uniref:Sushi domain-containing protein n=1 Tax=Castor canadensis TaxID=51338 RepID=A0A8C0XYB8_CASCN